MNEPYKPKNGKIDLLKDIDWKKVMNSFSSLKAVMDSLPYQPPEHVSENYAMLQVHLGIFAKELRLFDRTPVYRKALVDILELDTAPGPMLEEVKRIAKMALESGPEEK